MASNVWTAVGLANGAQGEAVHMQWSPGRAPTALTEVVFVRIAGYSGPPCFNETHVTIGDERIDLRNVVPVGSIEASDDQPPAARRNRGGAQGLGSLRVDFDVGFPCLRACVLQFAFLLPPPPR